MARGKNEPFYFNLVEQRAHFTADVCLRYPIVYFCALVVRNKFNSCELSNPSAGRFSLALEVGGGRVLAGFRQYISSFSELILMSFIAVYSIINSLHILKHETEVIKNNNFGRSSTLRDMERSHTEDARKSHA